MLRRIRRFQQLTYFSTFDNVEFKALNITKKITKTTDKEKRKDNNVVHQSRTEKMKIDQDWGSVWPGPKTFQPHSVPLPIRQGYVKPGQAIPDKYANAELMKIPNFLHLTPPVVERQCAILKRFCTEFPANLVDNDSMMSKYFPLNIIYSDYCYSSPSIRDPKSRIVTFKIKLDDLKLDEHARDKFLRLVEEKYNSDTGLVTIVVDRCPSRQQNMEYALYLLTAVVFESKKIESWESLKTESDMEYYDWDKNASRKNIVEIFSWGKSEPVKVEDINHVDDYKQSVSNIFNLGESDEAILNYKQSVLKLFDLR